MKSTLEEIIKKLEEFQKRLDEISRWWDNATDTYTRSGAHQKISAWREIVVRFLESSGLPTEARKVPEIYWDTNIEHYIKGECSSYIESLIYDLKNHPEEVLSLQAPAPLAARQTNSTASTSGAQGKPSPSINPKEIAEQLESYSKEMDSIYSELMSVSGWGFSRENHRKILLWKDRVELFLRKSGLKLGYNNFSQLEKPASSNVRELRHKVEDYLGYVNTLANDLKIHPKEIIELQQVETTATSIKEQKGTTATEKKKVFLVHGHDKANLYELKDLLKDRFKLNCVIMSKQPGKGRTLIEKFEQEAQVAGFAFILMTPDDLVKVEGKDEYAQARPNVIFELGWFFGQLGRDRVCIILKEGTEIHSDLKGISQIIFNKSVEEKVLEIETELRAAGLIG